VIPAGKEVRRLLAKRTGGADGGTIRIGHRRIGLHGIDAPWLANITSIDDCLLSELLVVFIAGTGDGQLQLSDGFDNGVVLIAAERRAGRGVELGDRRSRSRPPTRRVLKHDEFVRRGAKVGRALYPLYAPAD
jgi:hypothetical protein